MRWAVIQTEECSDDKSTETAKTRDNAWINGQRMNSLNLIKVANMNDLPQGRTGVCPV